MRVFTTILTQFLVTIIWFYFTHNFLTPRNKGFKREIIIFPVWMLYILATATILYEETALKMILMPILFFLVLNFIYELDIKRFLLVILYIFLTSLIGEIVGTFMVMVIFHASVSEMTYQLNLILLPFMIIIHLIIFQWILNKEHCLTTLPDVAIVFIVSQVLITILVDLNNQTYYDGRLLFPMLLCILIEMILQVVFWKKAKQYFTIKKEQRLHDELEGMYETELHNYIKLRDQIHDYKKLRHDLMNEIEIISIIEQQKQ